MGGTEGALCAQSVGLASPARDAAHARVLAFFFGRSASVLGAAAAVAAAVAAAASSWLGCELPALRQCDNGPLAAANPSYVTNCCAQWGGWVDCQDRGAARITKVTNMEGSGCSAVARSGSQWLAPRSPTRGRHWTLQPGQRAGSMVQGCFVRVTEKYFVHYRVTVSRKPAEPVVPNAK